MKITIKDVKDQQISFDMDDRCSVGDLLEKLHETHEFSACNYVVEGKLVNETTLLSDLTYSVIRLTTEMSTIPEIKYDSEAIHKALKGQHTTMIYLLHHLALDNPYILSYLASCPEMVVDHINQKLTDPNFSITVKGRSNYFQKAIDKYYSDLESLIDDLVESTDDDDDFDDISLPNLNVINPFIVDRDNVNRILRDANLLDSDFQRIKDIYLFMDRNYQLTLNYIRNDHL